MNGGLQRRIVHVKPAFGCCAGGPFSDLVSQYEQEHHAIEPAHPKDNLRFLMAARGLKQEDLSSLVAQSNLSAILAGKRKISATLAGRLGKFFGISPAVFIPA